MEQVFFRLHVRFVRAFCSAFTPSARIGLERLSLFNAFISLAVLVTLHFLFVAPNHHINCLSTAFDQIDVGQLKSFDVFEIRLTPHAQSEICSDGTNLNTCSFASTASTNTSSSSQAHIHMPLNAYYFSLEKGFLMLPPSKRLQYNISSVNININEVECFGSASGAWIMRNIVGEETAVMNWFLSVFNRQGYVSNSYSKEIFNLNIAPRPIVSSSSGQALGNSPSISTSTRNGGEDRVSFIEQTLKKIGIVCTTVFIFFSTTTLVSFTLRETQQRMLKFTFFLQDRISRRVPYGNLVFTHVIESVVFVPIIVGAHFFLVEFFSGQLIAFFVLSIVWISEVYSVICLRADASIKFFPSFFWWYFALFHLYFFSFPFGYTNTALITTALFLQHAMLYFWNQFEVPALECGDVSVIRPRSLVSAHTTHLENTMGHGHGRHGVSQMSSAGQSRRPNRQRSASDSLYETEVRDWRTLNENDRREQECHSPEYSYDYSRQTFSTDEEFDDPKFRALRIPGKSSSQTQSIPRTKSPLTTEDAFSTHLELSKQIQRDEVAAMLGVNAPRATQVSHTLSRKYGFRANRFAIPAHKSRRVSGHCSEGEDSPTSDSQTWQFGFQQPPRQRERGSTSSGRTEAEVIGAGAGAGVASVAPLQRPMEMRPTREEQKSTGDFSIFGVDLVSD